MSLLTQFLLGAEGPTGITGPTGAGSGGEHHEFEAVTGQTLFDTTPYFNIDGNYKVLQDGRFRSWGHTANGNTVAITSDPYPVYREEISIWQ